MTQWGVEGIFNPAKRHMDEEKRRLQSTREEVTDSSGGRRIDLESGKVVIRKRKEPGDAPSEALQAEDEPAQQAQPADPAEDESAD